MSMVAGNLLSMGLGRGEGLNQQLLFIAGCINPSGVEEWLVSCGPPDHKVRGQT